MPKTKIQQLGEFSRHLQIVNDQAATAAKCIYTIGRELTMIREYKLFENAGFANWAHFANSKDLEMPASRADKYMAMYRHAHRLGYSEVESKQLFQQFTVAGLMKVLPKLERKVTFATIARRIGVEADCKQLAFSLPEGDPDTKVIENVLGKFGMITDSITGRRSGAKDAMVKALRVADKAA